MTKLNMEEAWSQDPEPDRIEPSEAGVNDDWFDDIFDDEYMDDDPIAEEEVMDWARRFGGEL